MSNQIDQNGIQIQTHAEIIDELLNGTADYPGMYQIYGADINILPNSPDGQMLNIIAQAKLDMLEFIAQVYSSFDPDQAVGVQLDQRCAINGVVRMAGTYTQVYLDVTVDRALVLPGLLPTVGSTAVPNPSAFKAQDAAGNVYAMAYDFTASGAGTTSRLFTATVLGPQNPSVNTITIIATPTLGVTSVNNPTVPAVVGTTEESDYALRIRRARSVAEPSKGYLDGLYAALLAVPGVTSVVVYENNTGTYDTPKTLNGHTIWCIVKGGADADVAQAIYVHRNAGCGMKGSTTVNVTQIDSTTFVVAFDRPSAVNLYIEATLTPITGTVDLTYVKAQILAQLTYAIYQPADASAIVTLIRQIAPNVSVSACNVSNNGSSWVPLLSQAYNGQWALDASRITLS